MEPPASAHDSGSGSLNTPGSPTSAAPERVRGDVEKNHEAPASPSRPPDRPSSTVRHLKPLSPASSELFEEVVAELAMAPSAPSADDMAPPPPPPPSPPSSPVPARSPRLTAEWRTLRLLPLTQLKEEPDEATFSAASTTFTTIVNRKEPALSVKELIHLCPKPCPPDAAAAFLASRLRPPPPPSASYSAGLRLLLWIRRLCPAFVMGLLCVTLWASVRWSLPWTTEQPGVRGELPRASSSSSPSRALWPVSSWPSPLREASAPVRGAQSLPDLPAFAVADALRVNAETQRVLDLYCRGPLLHAVQMTGVFPDSKHFVDMPLKPNTSVFDVLVEFDRRGLAMTEFHAPGSDAHDAALRAFVDEHFDPPGTDLLPITPLDYQDQRVPPRIAGIQDAELRDWALSLHQLWRRLGRVPRPEVTGSYLHARALADPHLGRPHNVLIVPGGRFRESYYWDSYWIVQGLLVSDMAQTARGIVNNLLEYVAELGFVPNGGRIYYLTRSQPPMLSDMVAAVARRPRDARRVAYDISYLRSAVPILEHEYRFWMQRGPGGHAIELVDKDDNATVHVLNRYVSTANHPRPESYREDVAVAAEIFGDTLSADQGRATANEANKAKYYNDVIAAAESGWDFSSRWFRAPRDMRTIFTSCIVPVDLNSILYRMERNLMRFHGLLGNTTRATFFRAAAARRQRAMDAVLWNDTVGAWKDFDLERRAHSEVVSVSDFTPLWAGAFDPKDGPRLRRIVGALEGSGLLQVGGIQTTMTVTGQQWDAPNAWPPEQDIIIEGLLAANIAEAHALARSLTRTWVHTGLTAWRNTGLMFEKYNATEVGGLGVGGEYFPQFGFGWTNGVILKMLTVHQNLLVPP